MHHANLTDYVLFSDEGPTRSTVFESLRLWSQVLCLGRNQRYGPVTDEEADGMLTVLAGEAAFAVGGRRKRLKQWGTVLVPAGSEVAIANASEDPLVLLLVTAPPPVPREESPQLPPA